ncbi:MAG: ATP-binding protein [Muricauda sp.]|nr:ATP-binding protein [Allomuricauda sp.]MBO6589285.1 ATP-binding protein [Allomuricauda sp.]MBO6618910.1 ATP-binding protein [Allomuricauda sp.]MBO6644822.1 ATP-binding protein [Allomuricauda sp.]MBO6746723.1 ATP-binding protein [Allomuricauda sp.]MBO6843194.1 ATP-binding protein [Allomuricauda sp.]
MRIKRIEFKNNPILGDLQLDFTDEGKSVNTVILAGENGTGKTYILDTIFEFSRMKLTDKQKNEIRIFDIELSEKDIEAFISSESYKEKFENGFADGNLRIEFNFNITRSWKQIQGLYNDKKYGQRVILGNVFDDPDINLIFRAAYSDVEINYTPNPIGNVTAKDLDQIRNKSVKSSNNIATEITQLLVDIEALDSQDFANWAKKNIGNPIDETLLDIRTKRFKNAFNTIFPSKRMIGVQNVNGNKEVFFEEAGKRMSIGQLSSGEKQIVFRGGFLLKDQNSILGSIVLIDEPEISLHPRWQLQIMDFYKQIVSPEFSESKSQVIVSTHSPFIIHNYNRRDDKVVVLGKNEDGTIKVIDKPEFYGWTNKKMVKEAFDIDFGFKDEINKVFVEGETDEKYLDTARSIFELNDLSYEISWIGRLKADGNAEFTGNKALDSTKSFFRANEDMLKSKVVLLYDSDTKKVQETYSNLLVRTMPDNETNKLFKKGIENLFVLPDNFDISPFCDEKEKKDDYGAKSTIRSLNKQKLCKWICETCDIEKQKIILQNLKPLLLKIDEEVKK